MFTSKNNVVHDPVTLEDEGDTIAQDYEDGVPDGDNNLN